MAAPVYLLLEYLALLVESVVFLGIFLILIALHFRVYNWYFFTLNESSWQSIRTTLQFLQLGIVGLFLLIPEGELDRLSLRWMFLTLTYLMLAEQMASIPRRRPQIIESGDARSSSPAAASSSSSAPQSQRRIGNDRQPERNQESIRKELLALGRQALRQQTEQQGLAFREALKRTGLKADADLIRGVLEKVKQDPRFQVRVSPVIVGASQSQDIEIDNVPVSMDPQSIARLLRSMDPSIPEDIADSIIVKAPLPGVGLKGVNEVTTATIAEFPIGDRLLQRENRIVNIKF